METLFVWQNILSLIEINSLLSSNLLWSFTPYNSIVFWPSEAKLKKCLDTHFLCVLNPAFSTSIAHKDWKKIFSCCRRIVIWYRKFDVKFLKLFKDQCHFILWHHISKSASNAFVAQLVNVIDVYRLLSRFLGQSFWTAADFFCIDKSQSLIFFVFKIFRSFKIIINLT